MRYFGSFRHPGADWETLPQRHVFSLGTSAFAVVKVFSKSMFSVKVWSGQSVPATAARWTTSVPFNASLPVQRAGREAIAQVAILLVTNIQQDAPTPPATSATVPLPPGGH